MIREKNEFVEQSHNKFLQMAKDFIEVCPKCKMLILLLEKERHQNIDVTDCGNEFDDPKAKIVYTTQKQKNDFGRQYSNPDE